MGQIEKITINQVYINDKKKDGTPYITKTGNPFKMVIIKDQTGRSLSALDFDDKYSGIKVGDAYDVLVEQNGEFLNFKFPTKQDLLEIRVGGLEEKLNYVIKRLSDENILKKKGTTSVIQVEEPIITPPIIGEEKKEKVTVDQIPF